MRRLAAVYFFALFVCLTIIFVKTASAGDTLQTYHSIQYGFTIKYPESWERVTDAASGPLVLYAPIKCWSPSFRANINLAIENLPRRVTIREYARLAAARTKKQPGIKVLTQGPYTLQNGSPVYRLISTATVNGIQGKLFQITTLKDNKAYVLTYTADTSHYQTCLPAAQKIMNSFELP